MAEAEINFDAKVGSWVCIKRGKVENENDLIDASRILASIHESMDRKIWEFLKKDFNLEELDKIAYEITGAAYNEKKKVWELKGRVSEAQISAAIAACNSPTTTKKIPKSDNKHALEISKSYLTRKVIDLLGVRIELDPKAVEKYQEEKRKLGL